MLLLWKCINQIQSSLQDLILGSSLLCLEHSCFLPKDPDVAIEIIEIDDAAENSQKCCCDMDPRIPTPRFSPCQD